MSEIHCDFKVDYKKLKIFEENQITDIKYPVILSIPHAGTVFPDEFLNYTSRTIEELRSNEDLFVSDLIEPLMSEGIQVLSMNIASAFIDINRDKIELDAKMFYNYRFLEHYLKNVLSIDNFFEYILIFLSHILCNHVCIKPLYQIL